MDLLLNPLFWLGFAAAGGVGFLTFWIFSWLGDPFSMFRKQVVKHTTNKTPLDIVLESLSRLFLVWAVIFSGIFFFGWSKLSLPPEDAARLALIISLVIIFLLLIVTIPKEKKE
jgi:hypothetical protein